MSELGSAFLETYRERLQSLAKKAITAISQVADAELDWRPHGESNSIANLALHLAGSIDEWLVVGIGGAEITRDRDGEFNARGAVTRGQLVERLQAAFAAGDQILAGLSAERLTGVYRWREREVPMLFVLLTHATHLAEHIGQIIYIAKLRTGAGFQPLTGAHKKA